MQREGNITTQEKHQAILYPDSLRDYFAAAALQGTLASLAGDAALGGFIKAKEADGVRAEVALAQSAYEIADAMLKAREAKSAG